MSLAKTVFYAECVFLALMVIGVLGQRFQFLPFKVAFGGFALAVALAALGALIALVVFGLSFGPASSGARMPSIYAFLMGLVPLVMIVMLVGAGFKVPRIHDISTDLENNIAFTNAKKLRKSTDNSLEFPSDEVIKQHQGFYGHVEPLLVDDTPSAAYEKSLSTAESLGWKILHRDDANTTFEATQTTAVFGFVDDIVVRVSSAEQGSKIDLRSVSRVGLSDLGANAKRILTFQEAYK